MGIRAETNLRINMGCGRRVLDGYFNIDIAHDEKAPRVPDLLCDITQGIPLPDSCAIELLAVHVVEHFFVWDVDKVLTEWARLLAKGGKLIIEMPDLIKCCENIIKHKTHGGKHPDQLGRFGLYGDPRLENPYMLHKWLYTPQEVIQMLKTHGFTKVSHVPTQFHPVGKSNRDMRIEGIKA